LAFIDLHWSTTEHAIKDNKLNMEAQLHHFNSWFDTYEDAVANQGQTLAVAILFEVQCRARLFPNVQSLTSNWSFS
jgi:hypothetical protein